MRRAFQFWRAAAGRRRPPLAALAARRAACLTGLPAAGTFDDGMGG